MDGIQQMLESLKSKYPHLTNIIDYAYNPKIAYLNKYEVVEILKSIDYEKINSDHLVNIISKLMFQSNTNEGR